MEQAKTPDLEKEQSRAVLPLALSMLLASLGTSIANIALPALTEAFSAPFSHVQTVVVAYLATLTVFVIIAGRFGDRSGLKPMLVAGLGIFTLASFMCAMAPNLPFLIGARALQGAGAAFLMTLAMALMRQTVSDAHVGRAMGLLGTASALGTAIGPSLGGLLIPVTGWRGVFWVQVPLAIVTVLLVLRRVRHPADSTKVVSTGFWSMLNGSVLPYLFINILVAAVMMTTLVVGPFYLALALGLNETLIGFVMAVGPIISIASGLPSGRLVDAWGSSRVLAIGLALLAVGTFLMAILPNRTGIVGYVLSIIVLTPGYQLFQAANNTAALAEISKRQHATISGLLGFSRNIGLIAGASVMGAIFAFGTGTEDFVHAAPSAIARGMEMTFVSASAMMILAIGIAFMSRKATKTDNRPR